MVLDHWQGTEKIGDFGLNVASKPIKKNVDSLLGTNFDSLILREKGSTDYLPTIKDIRQVNLKDY